MGAMKTAELADRVGGGHIDLTRAVGIHLTTNFYPPIPGELTEPVVQAIQAVAEDDGARMIPLSNAKVLPRRAEKVDGVWMVDADELVSITHAGPFVRGLRDAGPDDSIITIC